MLFAFLVRLLYVRATGIIVSSDGSNYVHTAEALARGSFYSFKDMPLQQLYALLLSPAFRFSLATNRYVLILNSVLGTLGILFSLLILKSWRSDYSVILGGFLVAVSPNLIFWTPYLLTDTLFIAVLGLFILSHLYLQRHATIKSALFYLVALVVLLTTRTTGLAAGIASVSSLLISKGKGRLIWQAATVGIFLLPVLFFNNRLSASILGNEYISGTLAYTVRLGDNDMKHFQEAYQDRIATGMRIRQTNPLDRDFYRAMSLDALNKIQAHPLGFAGMVMRRFVAFWHPWIFGNQYSRKHRVFEMMNSLFLSACILVLLARKYAFKTEILGIVGMAGAFSVLCAFLQIDTDNRYRLPAEYIVLTLAPIAGLCLMKKEPAPL
jgi:hypothetical protein